MKRPDVVAEVLEADTDLPAIAEELEADPDEVVRKVAPGRAAFRARAIVGAAPGELPEIEAATRRHLATLVEPSREAVRKILKEGRSADLTKEERQAAEAIVLLMARPAILIQDGSFFPPPPPWSRELENARAEIEAVLASVGRIELTGHPEFDWVGTGWLLTEDIVVTNRHVAETFTRVGSRQRWTFSPGLKARVDFAEELNTSRPREFDLVEIVGVHDTHDLALLRVRPNRGGPLPPPLPLAAKPRVRKGSKVYVVGYPAADSRRNDPEEMQRIFSGIYNVKRLQPGKLRSVSRARAHLVHDCSTLGGNSGSCLVDLKTHRVIGLHFGGRYLQGNEAVALWQLAGDPLLKKAKIPFI